MKKIKNINYDKELLQYNKDLLKYEQDLKNWDDEIIEYNSWKIQCAAELLKLKIKEAKDFIKKHDKDVK